MFQETPRINTTEQSIDESIVPENQTTIVDNLFMYAFPGHELTESDVDKYLRSNEKLKEELPQLIQQALKNKGSILRLTAVSMIQYAPEQERAILIRQALKDEIPIVRASVARMIQYAPEQEQEALRLQIASLIQRAPKDKDFVDLESVLLIIQYASKQEQEAFRLQVANFICQAFKNKGPVILLAAARMIQYAPEQEQEALRLQVANLIQEALRYGNSVIRESVTTTIQYAPEQERANLIHQALKDEDFGVRASATEMIQYAPEQERANLIRQALKDKEPVVRISAIRMIKYAPEQEKEALYKQMYEEAKLKPRKLQRLADETPLYRDAKGKFVRKPFPKTGSEVVLLNKVPGREVSLKEQVIVRRIDIPAYLEWKKTFEAHSLWQQRDFDYVPVEPILRIQLSKNQPTKVNVFTRVIRGPAVAEWEEKSGMFLPQIHQQVEKIKQVLQELGIEHGHLHEGNFVLYFSRDKDGKADLTKPPRVYVIDFDQAVSSG